MLILTSKTRRRSLPMKINRKSVRALCALMTLSLALTGCSRQYYGGITERTDGVDNAYTEDILPESQNNAYSQQVDATLYFRYLSEDLLAGVEQQFNVTAENTLEQLVVQALIDGPQETQYQYNALINPDTRVVSVKEQSGYLSVTLSSEFLERMGQDIDQEATRRRLGVLSIVNAVTAIGNYSRVLILIDENNTGNGERLTYAEAGWEELGERTIEPMERDSSVILSPENVLDTVMSAIVEKNYERLEYYLAAADYDGAARPNGTGVAEAFAGKASIVGYSLEGPANVSGDGKRAVLMLSITYIDAGGHTAQLTALPIRMLREDVWKVSFQALNTMFPEY